MNSPHVKNHDSLLKESIKHFLTSYHRGSSDFSSFESIFFRLIQSMLDPPLGVTWFYSAVTFHAAKSSSQNSIHPSARVVITKDLLNLLISCSNLSSVSKKISLLAPVVYDLYNVVCDYGKDVNMEVRKLVEDIVNYVMTLAAAYDYGNEDVNCNNSVVCFEDLVRVWTTDRGGAYCSFEENLRVFFPFLSDGIWKWVSGGGCGLRELVGIVLCEVYFLRMFVSVGSVMCTEDFLRETFDETVQTIKGFRSSYFLDVLLKMLLEPNLPVASLLSFEDADILHKALYDAVLLIDYSFYSGRWAHSNDSHSKNLALLWVLVADRAIHFARTKNDEDKAVLYLSAFRESHLMAELIEWACIQAGIVDQNIRTFITTPSALIKWLFALEDQEIQVFDHSVSLHYSKAVSRAEMTTRDHDMAGPSENRAGRKRKETDSGLQDMRGTQMRRVTDNATHSGVELINLSSKGKDVMES